MAASSGLLMAWTMPLASTPPALAGSSWVTADWGACARHAGAAARESAATSAARERKIEVRIVRLLDRIGIVNPRRCAALVSARCVQSSRPVNAKGWGAVRRLFGIGKETRRAMLDQRKAILRSRR